MAQQLIVQFTRQFLLDIQAITTDGRGKKQLLTHLEEWVLPSLQSYPASGRLLLNRLTQDAEIKRLNEQLKQWLQRGELREYAFEGYLIIYLLHAQSLYLLCCLPLKKFGQESELLWQEEGVIAS